MELKVFKENEMVQVDFLGTPTDYVQLDMQNLCFSGSYGPRSKTHLKTRHYMFQRNETYQVVKVTTTGKHLTVRSP